MTNAGYGERPQARAGDLRAGARAKLRGADHHVARRPPADPGDVDRCRWGSSPEQHGGASPEVSQRRERPAGDGHDLGPAGPLPLRRGARRSRGEGEGRRGEGAHRLSFSEVPWQTLRPYDPERAGDSQDRPAPPDRSLPLERGAKGSKIPCKHFSISARSARLRLASLVSISAFACP